MIRRAPTKRERNAEILRLYAAGQSLREIGAKFLISHEAVRIIIKRQGGTLRRQWSSSKWRWS